MNLEDIYYISQISAVFAVVLSLLFVGFQVRQNTKAVKASSHQAITDAFNQLNIQIGTNPEVGRIYRLGIEGSDELTEDERQSFSYLMISYMRVFETLFFQHSNGTLDSTLFETGKQSISWACSRLGFKNWWHANPVVFSAEFTSFIENLVDQQIVPSNVDESSETAPTTATN